MNAPTATATIDRATGEILATAAGAPTTDFERLLQQTFSPREILDGDSLEKMYRVADSLANSKISVPEHLRGNVGDCLAIVTQAMLWNMNPFAVAQKTHIVSGRLGYEAQLVNAVLQNSGAVRGLPHYEYKGDGAGLECRVGFVARGGSGEVIFGEWLKISDVTTKNSPLWKTNPKQQLGYLQIKNWARAFVPGAILGVYTVDELDDADIPPRPAADATPRDLPRNATPVQVGAAAAPKAERTLAHAKIVADLEVLAFNQGSAALADAWKALTKPDRTAIGPAELERLKGIAKECDDLAAAARAQAEADAAQQTAEPGDGE